MASNKLLDKIVWVNTSSIKPYKGNPKIHSSEQIEKLAGVFAKYGFDVPIVVDEDNVIIKGHARLAAAKKLKWKEVPVIYRKDLTEQQAKASRIADNIVSESYWDMPNLIAELEALYNLDDSGVNMIDTGFSDTELKSLLPGLLETEETDYAIAPNCPLGGFVSRMRQDGKIGGPVAKLEKLPADILLNKFKTVIIPVFGGYTDIASVLEAMVHRKKYKIILLYSYPGGAQFEETLPYLQRVSKVLDIPIVELRPKSDETFRGRVSTQGFPSADNLWCEGIVIAQIEEYLAENKLLVSSTVMLLGAMGENAKAFRRVGKFDQGYFYFCPFAGFTERKLHAYLKKGLPKGLGLHPLYCHLTMIACAGCPLFCSPDFAWLQSDEGALHTWLQVLEYFGYAKRNRSYRYGGKFDSQLKTFIAEGIEPRNVLLWSDLAMNREEVLNFKGGK